MIISIENESHNYYSKPRNLRVKKSCATEAIFIFMFQELSAFGAHHTKLSTTS